MRLKGLLGVYLDKLVKDQSPQGTRRSEAGGSNEAAGTAGSNQAPAPIVSWQPQPIVKSDGQRGGGSATDESKPKEEGDHNNLDRGTLIEIIIKDLNLGGIVSIKATDSIDDIYRKLLELRPDAMQILE